MLTNHENRIKTLGKLKEMEERDTNQDIKNVPLDEWVAAAALGYILLHDTQGVLSALLELGLKLEDIRSDDLAAMRGQKPFGDIEAN